MLRTLSHPPRSEDVVYNFKGSSTRLFIGACSYTARLNVYDFAPTRPAGSHAGSIIIKRFCSLGDNITLHMFGSHDYKKISTNPLTPIAADYQQVLSPEPSETLTIGNDVWIGNSAVILSDVNIGDGCVIGANTVVAKSFPPYSVVVGNPAKIVKYRFDEETIKKLLEIAWWNWPFEKIKEHQDLIRGSDVGHFISKFK